MKKIRVHTSSGVPINKIGKHVLVYGNHTIPFAPYNDMLIIDNLIPSSFSAELVTARIIAVDIRCDHGFIPGNRIIIGTSDAMMLGDSDYYIISSTEVAGEMLPTQN